MTIEQYLDTLNHRYQLGNATEHSFRGDLQQLLETLLPGVRATNEPKCQSCGAPDYILTRQEIPLGFIEAKDLGDKDLDGHKANKPQFDRYKASLDNLLFTDYLRFHFYRSGQPTATVALAELTPTGIRPLPGHFSAFRNLIADFGTYSGQTIKSAKRLAELMAAKARLLSDIIENALDSDQHHDDNSTLRDQLAAFQQVLIHDITAKGFADVYAQTIAYGLFAARLHDPTLPTFSRQEAAELIPKTNPFLRKLFGYIAGPDLDDRIRWVVDSLVEIFLACNVEQLLKNYGTGTRTEDPIIHFYETFLSEYDPKLRKARGVWYTPAPVVSFIVRAVDELLKTEFGLSQGLADTAKTTVKVNLQATDKRFKDNIRTTDEEVHRVQILDPATGTGTFLAEVVRHIHRRFAGQQGIWSQYVGQHLLPRLNGFELLMASYAMAHLQLDLLLTGTGYRPATAQRLRVYLTNSLEEHHPDTGTLFANWLSQEANEANRIKRDTPVMCVLGNPPYSGESANKGEWIMRLMDDYKKEPGGREKLNEKNPKWINDDYVKFIRYGQHFIEKNGSGILAFINPHGFLDNPTFRGMRWHLLKTFDSIYTLDLHGNSKKKETAPDGSPDENVFDIQQGVSINFFVKTGRKNPNALAQVFHYDLYGKREPKYDFLAKTSIRDVAYTLLQPTAPNYFFVQKDFDVQGVYEQGFSVNELFPLNNVGIVTARDNFTIHDSIDSVKNTIEEFLSVDDEKARERFDLGKDVRDWQVNFARKDLQKNYPNVRKFTEINYRPFDAKWTFYTGNSKGFHCYPRNEVMQHFLKGKNVGLVLARQATDDYWSNVQVSNKIIDNRFHFSYKGIPSIFPLYVYPDTTGQQTIGQTPTRRPNLNAEIVQKIAAGLGLGFVPEPETEGEVCFANNPNLRPEYRTTFSPLDVLDYIYAVLHSPTYRQTYKEFLKIDFPRIPYPADAVRFWGLVALGGELRRLHLLESAAVEEVIAESSVAAYPQDGDNIVTKPTYSPAASGDGRVYINDTQYFDHVPGGAWAFYIGGYQPAQKWLKDRKGRALGFEDIMHYRRIIVALTETARIMAAIDAVGV